MSGLCIPSHQNRLRRGTVHRSTAAILALLLLLAACSEPAESDAGPSTITTVAGTTGAVDQTPADEPAIVIEPADPAAIEACQHDARVGLAVMGAGMAGVTDESPSDLIDDGWQDLMEGDATFDAALAALGELDRTCETGEMLAVHVVDLADEILPVDLADTIVWVQGIGGTVGIARTVEPSRAEAMVAPAAGDGADWPFVLDLDDVADCGALTEGTVAHIHAYIDAWSGLNPTELASNQPRGDLGRDIQTARLWAAQQGCDLAAHAETALLTLATTASDSFVARGLRLTYAQWILEGMLTPTYVADDVIAQPIGDLAGDLLGFAVHNRADQERTGVSVSVDGEIVVSGLSLEPGQSAWLPFPIAAPSEVTVDWDR